MEMITLNTMPCRVCGEASTVTVPQEGYDAWRKGAYVQDAFPEMLADERELLISGTHPVCWDLLFSDE